MTERDTEESHDALDYDLPIRVVSLSAFAAATIALALFVHLVTSYTELLGMNSLIAVWAVFGALSVGLYVRTRFASTPTNHVMTASCMAAVVGTCIAGFALYHTTSALMAGAFLEACTMYGLLRYGVHRTYDVTSLLLMTLVIAAGVPAVIMLI